MNNPTKEILLFIYNNGKDCVDITPLLVNANPSRSDLLNRILSPLLKPIALIEYCGSADPFDKYLKGFQSSNIGVQYREYAISEVAFIYSLTPEGIKAARTYADDDKPISHYGDVVRGNKEHYEVTDSTNVTFQRGGDSSSQNATQSRTKTIAPTTPPTNAIMRFLQKFWWIVIVGIFVGLAVIYIAQQLGMNP